MLSIPFFCHKDSIIENILEATTSTTVRARVTPALKGGAPEIQTFDTWQRGLIIVIWVTGPQKARTRSIGRCDITVDSVYVGTFDTNDLFWNPLHHLLTVLLCFIFHVLNPLLFLGLSSSEGH